MSPELGFFLRVSFSVGSWAFAARRICGSGRGLLFFSVSDDMVIGRDTSGVLGQEASGAPELGVLFGIYSLGSWAPAARRIFGAERELLFVSVRVHHVVIVRVAGSLDVKSLVGRQSVGSESH